MPIVARLLASLLAVIAVASCGGAATSATATPTASATPAPTPTDDPLASARSQFQVGLNAWERSNSATTAAEQAAGNSNSKYLDALRGELQGTVAFDTLLASLPNLRGSLHTDVASLIDANGQTEAVLQTALTNSFNTPAWNAAVQRQKVALIAVATDFGLPNNFTVGTPSP